MDERLKETVAFVKESGLVKYSLEVGGIAARIIGSLSMSIGASLLT